MAFEYFTFGTSSQNQTQTNGRYLWRKASFYSAVESVGSSTDIISEKHGRLDDCPHLCRSFPKRSHRRP